MTTYYESAEEVTITLERAAQECWKHGCSVIAMVDDLGLQDTYAAQDVLGWLGY
jgi:hypothetical protein